MKHHDEVKHFNIPVDLSMYDKLPYSINPETKRQISLVSGNVLKYYYVTMDEEKKVIDPNDSDPNIIDSSATESVSSEYIDEVYETTDDSNDLSTEESQINDEYSDSQSYEES